MVDVLRVWDRDQVRHSERRLFSVREIPAKARDAIRDVVGGEDRIEDSRCQVVGYWR